MDTALEWMRPEWLWGFVPLLVVIFFWFRLRSNNGAWESFVDPALQPYVIEGQSTSTHGAPILMFAAWALALLMLAGPVWQQREVPVFEAEKAEVIVFDLSLSMRADDVKPDRLTRARFKLIDLLQRSDGMQSGLIAFAQRPYVISPLTDDANTIEAFVPSLEPEIMPAQGSRPDLAIEQAVQLLKQASVGSGHILLITDAAASQQDLDAAANARTAGHRVSVLAIGTAAGAPLRAEDGQFFQYSDGAIVVSQLDIDSLNRLSAAGGGKTVSLTTSGKDLDALDSVRRSLGITAQDEESTALKVYWVEYSPWLLWPLLGALLFAFRRGVIA
ncbi:hypothetical protein IMCC3135_27285 [Granulosicoccus antarcticus IMCC3135]|uniref:VWFA domain-containing protein n=2 Tax=Granulosicoccus TaxID=437504 RepID=A0A2Z2NVK8_9GAMM|nr:hypothetical protein IMCC3135_27285 [Granulosicoccus antarcticus IMCC3135]